MRIKRKGSLNTIFRDVPCGNLFRMDELVCLKTITIFFYEKSSIYYNAINVADGSFIKVPEDAMVVHLEDATIEY